MYELVSGPLEGSFDHRISCRLQRHRYVSVEGRYKKQTVKEECPPYLEIEGSVHKAMCGHNVYGGPVMLLGACVWLIRDVGERLGVWLPYAADWTIRRLDWSEVFDLGAVAVGEYIWSLRQAAYPKRNPSAHGNETVFFPGRSTTVKFYHKGPEFQEHDRKRLLASPDTLGVEWVHDLARRADGYLRVEVGIRATVLDKAYGGAPLVSAVAVEWVQEMWEREVMKVLREGRSDMAIVRRSSEVSERLHAVYTARQASALYATWVALSTLGEDKVKASMVRPTFYKHRVRLVEAGCSWLATDLQLVERPSLVPMDFAPTRLDARRVSQVEPRVALLMARMAA
jgi:II/X family phage/plasmid replication protein